MAQKILIRRGGIGNINSTIAISKGELLFATGSSNGIENVVFVGNADGNNTFTPVNKIYTGTASPTSFVNTLNGLPYYKTDSQALFILNNAGSTALDLSGNLEGTTISNITATGSFTGSFVGNGSGLTSLTLGSIAAPGSNTQLLFNNAGAIAATSNLTVTGTIFDTTTLNISTTGNISGSNLKLTGNADITGNINIGGNITVGDVDTDFVSFKADISSSIIPDLDSAFDLGSTTKYWSTVYADNFSGSAGSIADVTTLNAASANVTGTISGSELRVINNADIGGNLTVPNLRGYNSLFGTPSSAVKSFTVTVVTKSANHRYFGTGSSSGYHIDGVESPFITLLPGKTYRFLQDNGSNSSHQILFYYKADKSTPGQYTTNVTTNGTAGSAGSYTQIVVTDTTPVVLHYQCVNHGYMGNAAQLNSNVVDTPYQIFARSGITVTGSAVLGGSLSVAGLTNLNGNVVLGDTAADTIAFIADVSSSILPSAANTFDIGSSVDTWRTGFFGTGVSSSGFLHAATNLDVDGISTLTGNASLGGTLTVTGLTTLNGSTILGDAGTDTVAFVADVSSSIIPSGNDLFDLGATSDKWRFGYFVSASIDSLQIGGIDPTAQDLDDIMNNGNSTNNDFILNSNGNQSITHTGTTGNLSISSQNGNTVIEGTTFAGNDVTIPGNLTVQGTTTTIDSTIVNIGDNIIVLNAAGIVADGGIQVRDTTGTTGTGSLLWNATSDYWYAGVSGSTHDRLTTFASGTGITTNVIPKADGTTRLTNSIITDNGSLVTVAGDISGSLITAQTGITSVGLQGVIDTSSRVIFRDASNRLGALATSDSAVEVSTILGYKADGTLVATSVIDGGTF